MYTYRDRAEICVGDVIVYPHPFGTVDVVRRVIEIRPDGVITRGDNNNRIDPYTVRFDDIIGKVIAAKRKNRRIPIKGGKTGFGIHKFMLLRKYSMQYGLPPLGAVSNIIAASGIFNVLHPVLNLRVVRINGEHRRQSILVSGNRAIGRLLEESGEWQIRFPINTLLSNAGLEKAGLREQFEP
jgi:hypothetical protein